MSGALAERAFADKLHRVGLRDVEVVERRSWGIEDCARYPLFDDELLDLMRRLVPPSEHGQVATVVTFVGHCPAPDDGADVLIAAGDARNRVHLDGVSPTRTDQSRRSGVAKDADVEVAGRYDAGDLGCGDGLPRELRRRLAEIPVGSALEVIVRDPSAKADLPPLVRMMGHRVRSEEAQPDGRLVIEVERMT